MCAVSVHTPAGPTAYRYSHRKLRLPDSVLAHDTATRIVHFVYRHGSEVRAVANCRIPNTAAAATYLSRALAPKSRSRPASRQNSTSGISGVTLPGTEGSGQGWDDIVTANARVCDNPWNPNQCDYSLPGDPPPGPDPCVLDPTARDCGPFYGGSNPGGGPGSDPGDPYDPCRGDNFVPSVPEIPTSQFPPDDAPNSTFDCKQTQCPSAETIVNSPEVVAAEKGLADQSAGSDREYGAWIFKMPDGSIQTGVVYPGGVVGLRQYYAGSDDPNICGTGYQCVPEITSEPQLQANSGIYIIGSIHSHPPTTRQVPTGDDFRLATHNDAYVLVAMQESTIVIDRNGQAVAQCPRPVYGSCRTP